jgi:hypothetical protein
LRRLLRIIGEGKSEQRSGGDKGKEYPFHDEKV